MWPFSYFQYCARSFRSTADLLTVVSDRIARAFNGFGATKAVALDISKAFDRVWHAGLCQKLKSYGISSQIFGHISSFPINAGFSRSFVLGSALFLLYCNDLSSVILLSLLMILLSTLNVIRDLICGIN